MRVARADRLALAVVAALATVALAAGLAGTDLWPPDETRVAEVAREMHGARDWMVPRLNGEPFLEEPPLFYWLAAATYRVAGAPSAAAARIPAAAAAVAGVLVTIGLAAAVGADPVVAALVLATAPQYWWMARSGTPDTTNAAATGLALVAFLVAWRSGRAAALWASAVGLAVAFWSKSFLGPGLAVLTMGGFVATAGLGRIPPGRLACAALLPAAAVVAWLVTLAHAEGGDAVLFFVVKNHLGRLLGNRDEGHVRPVYYYVKSLALDLAPWSVVLPAALVAARRSPARGAPRFPLVWAGVMTLALSASASKSAHYLLPAYPAFAVLVAQWWARAPERRLDRTTWAVLAAAMLVVLPTLAFAVASLDPSLVMPAVADDAPRGGTAAALLAAVEPGRWAWTAALVALVGVGVPLARRARRAPLAAAAVGVAALVLHLLVAWVTLPRFNPFASARAVGEALGRVARARTPVLAYGFDNRERLSPLLFYAEHGIVEVRTRKRLAHLLLGRRACAVVATGARARLPASLQALPASDRLAGRLAVTLVSGSDGGCPAPDG